MSTQTPKPMTIKRPRNRPFEKALPKVYPTEAIIALRDNKTMEVINPSIAVVLNEKKYIREIYSELNATGHVGEGQHLFVIKRQAIRRKTPKQRAAKKKSLLVRVAKAWDIICDR